MNLTLNVDDDLLKSARIRALEENTSVNALVREFLEDYVGRREEQTEAVRRILELSDASDSGSGPEGRTWKRMDLYDRAVFRR